jgi:hypothetical protein
MGATSYTATEQLEIYNATMTVTVVRDRSWNSDRHPVAPRSLEHLDYPVAGVSVLARSSGLRTSWADRIYV